MALGDGIRRNISSIDPAERAMLRDALIQLNSRKYPGSRTDPVPGGVTWWFKQDEIHQATHVHGGPEFLPWHREIVNRLEELLRQINPLLSRSITGTGRRTRGRSRTPTSGAESLGH